MAEPQNSAATFAEVPTAGGGRIGLATLNNPKALNALSLEMIDLLYERLLQWQDDPELVAVWLDGAGDRAFCAGGDIVRLYEAMGEHPGEIPPLAEAFFGREYRLDYLIHRFPKPIICWGSGVVMGGGLGLMAGASHRVVTETTRIAMPEINIGLYPDVGGTWFLNRMPQGTGLFLGITGAHCNGADALAVGWADQLVGSERREELLARLRALDWQGGGGDRERVTELLAELDSASRDLRPEGQVATHLAAMETAAAAETISTAVNAILAIPDPDKWLARAQQSLANGCPTTAHLVWRQLREGGELSLADVFRRELIMSVQCAAHGEFREGVRALLIDKDNRPRWRYRHVDQVPESYVDEFFASPWPESAHPLRDIEEIDNNKTHKRSRI